MRKRTPPHSIVCCRRWRFAVHAVRLVLDCSEAIVGFLCARVNAVPVRSSPPIRLAMLTSAWRAARHRERERIKSDVGLAEEGKRIGRPTISRRLRERVAERIAAGETPSRVAKDIVLRRPSYFFMQRVNSLDQCCSLRRSKIFSGTSDRHRAPRLPGPTADLWVSHRRRTSMAEV